MQSEGSKTFCVSTILKSAVAENDGKVANLEFEELIIKRRSIRKFKKDAVPDKLIRKILEACRWAPSAGNSQPWHIIVITDNDVKTRIAETCTKYSREHWKKFPPDRARYLAARGGTWDKSYMKDIPVLLAVTYKSEKRFRNELALGSTWIAVENMMLAITNDGLASCIYTFLNRTEENKIVKILQVPHTHRIACILQVGYAEAQPPKPLRKELEEITSYQHF
jgi:nitroreductase